MKTNKAGYPVYRKGGKWAVGDYTDTPPAKVRVITRRPAAERLVKEWNSHE